MALVFSCIGPSCQRRTYSFWLLFSRCEQGQQQLCWCLMEPVYRECYCHGNTRSALPWITRSFPLLVPFPIFPQCHHLPAIMGSILDDVRGLLSLTLYLFQSQKSCRSMPMIWICMRENSSQMRPSDMNSGWSKLGHRLPTCQVASCHWIACTNKQMHSDEPNFACTTSSEFGWANSTFQPQVTESSRQSFWAEDASHYRLNFYFAAWDAGSSSRDCQGSRSASYSRDHV